MVKIMLVITNSQESYTIVGWLGTGLTWATEARASGQTDQAWALPVSTTSGWIVKKMQKARVPQRAWLILRSWRRRGRPRRGRLPTTALQRDDDFLSRMCAMRVSSTKLSCRC